MVAAEGAGPKRVRRVTDRAALLDLWAEEVRDRGVKQLRAFRFGRDPRTLTAALGRTLTDAGVDHTVTGAAAAATLAPFVTAIPVTEVWVGETVALEEAALAAGAEVVEDGHNVVLAQARDDAPLVFRQKVDDFWRVNVFRLFYDLRRDPRRGREQAQRLREEVIGFEPRPSKRVRRRHDGTVRAALVTLLEDLQTEGPCRFCLGCIQRARRRNW